LRKVAHDSNRDKPCNDRSKKSNASTHCNWAPMHAIIADQAGRYRREHQNALNEDADVKNCHRLAAVRFHRIRGAFCRNSLPYQDRNYERGGKN
jgi:hypothetical protein